jgi:hypothetical protein
VESWRNGSPQANCPLVGKFRGHECCRNSQQAVDGIQAALLKASLLTASPVVAQYRVRSKCAEQFGPLYLGSATPLLVPNLDFILRRLFSYLLVTAQADLVSVRVAEVRPRAFLRNQRCGIMSFMLGGKFIGSCWRHS